MIKLYLFRTRNIIGKVLISLLLFIPYQVFAGDAPDCDFGDLDGYFYHWNFDADNLEFDLELENLTEESITDNITEYTIDWGDGSDVDIVTNKKFPLDHTYASEGQFTLSISITYSGEDYTYEYIVYNTKPKVETEIVSGDNGCTGQEYVFILVNYEDNPPLTKYSWTFGDGVGSTVWTLSDIEDNNATISHTYDSTSCDEEGDTEHFSAGATPVLYIDGNTLVGLGTMATPIIISEDINMDVGLKINDEIETFTDAHTGCVDHTTFSFTNDSDYGLNDYFCTPTSDHEWTIYKTIDGVESEEAELGIDYEFSSGSADDTGDIEIIFLKTGTYKIAFYLENSCSSFDIETGEISIYDNENTTTYTPEAFCLTDDETVSFTTSEDPEIEAIQESTYLWSSSAESYEFVEETSSTSQNPKIKFYEAGKHTVSLEKTSLCGTEEYEYVVEVSDIPIVSINALTDLTNGGYCGTFTFSPTATFTDNGEDTFDIDGNVIDEYKWTFTNNGTSTYSEEEVPGEITFDQVGTSSISLEAHNNCGWSEIDQIDFEIYEIPTPVIDCIDEACEEEEISYVAQPDDMQSYSWLFGNGNTGSGQNSTNIFLTAGTYTDKLSVTSTDGCTNSVTNTIEIIAKPTVSAGSDLSICASDNSFEITDASAEDYTTIEWVTSGDGTFVDDDKLLTTYNLGEQDQTSSTIELTLTVGGIGSCGKEIDSKTVTITPIPTIILNESSSKICQYSSYDITNIEVENTSSVEWNSSEAGTFSNKYSANTSFTPDSDVSGTVTLILTAYSIGSCAEMQASIELEVVEYPTVDAGEDSKICEGEEVSLSGICSSSVVEWESSGDGVFSTENALITTYTPGSDDIDNESVTLTLSALGDAPCEASDSKNISITKKPSVSAGADVSICKTVTSYTIQTGSDSDMAQASNYASLLWTSSGTGSLSNETSLAATYEPSEEDLTNGSVELTIEAQPEDGCSDALTDNMTLTFTNPPEVNAGSDITGCQDTPIELSATAKYQSDVLWTSSGSGVFEDPTLLTTSYQPDADETGNYTLTLTVESEGSCDPVSDELKLTLIGKVKANAGSDGEVCSNDSYNLSSGETGASSYSASEILWTGGDGSFDDPTSINATYTPGENDMISTSVTLTLTAQALSPCSEESSDEMILTITPAPTANAGEDQAICQGEILLLTGASAENYSSVQWETSSTSGFFANETSLDATYHPGEDDTGKYTLTLIAYGEGSCSSIEDEMELSITPAPTVELEDEADICEDGSYTFKNAQTKNSPSYTWVNNGLGTLSNTDGLTPTYQAADGETGDIDICLTAEGNGMCSSKTACTTLSIIPHPSIDAGDDGEVCSNAIYEMNVGSETGQVNAESWSSIEYSTSGDGYFTDQDGLNANYVPGDNDKVNQEVEITIKAYAINPPCDESVEDTMTLNITPAPAVNAGTDDVICQNDSYQLVNASEENTSTLSWSCSVGGSFDDVNTLQATYTPKTDKTGIIQLLLTGEGNGSCENDSDGMSLQIIAVPKVDAGEDAEICFNKTYELTGSVASSFSSISWTTSGSGSFTDSTLLQPIYQPSDEDYENGSVQLTITVQGLTPCLMEATDNLELQFVEAPYVYAGEDEEICEENGTYTITSKSDENPNGAEVKNVSSYIWETDGKGSLQNSNTLTPTYIPAESETGIIHLTITAEGYSNCESIEDEMELTIIPTPSVDFTIGTSCIGSMVSFEDESTNGSYSIESWSWDFGDGSTSEEQNPSHEFADVGNYSVTLSVTNNKGCTASSVKTASIHSLPSIEFTHDDFTGINVSTQFDNESLNAISYNWDFGDGETSTEEDPSHSYTSAGIYTIVLEGESEDGCISTDSSTIEVIGQPEASFTKSADGCGPLTVEFTNTSTGKFLSYYWDFGNGTTSTEEEVDPIVFAPGTVSDTTYTVSLTIENKAGTSTFSATVTVKPLPVPEFEILPTAYGCSPVVRSIYNQTTGLPNSYSFDFGDGTTYEYETPDVERPFDHTFTSDDTKTIFPITLTASNECGDQSITKNMTVFPNTAVAVIKADQTSGCAPLTVSFENLSTGAGDYLESDWIFEDNIVESRDETGETVYHTFEDAGVYEVELTVHDTCATDNTSVQITVVSASEIDFNISYTRLCESEEISFSVSDETLDEFTNFTWDLGDGTSLTGTQIDHEFATAQTYTIQLSAISLENGCEKTVSKEITINKTPSAEFDISSNEGCEPLEVIFTNQSTDADYYQWNFKDGAETTQENAEHTFTSGDYEISLIAESEAGCLDSTSMEISVHSTPNAAFDLAEKIGCTTPFIVEVSNNTEDKELNSYTWNFDNGTISNQTDPEAESYSDYGQYTISLKAENKYLCVDSCSQELSIYETPIPDLEILSTTSCEGEIIEFEDKSENSITSYWEFSDGFTTEGKTASHIFSDYGQYDLFLKSVGEGNCADSIYLENAVQVYPIPYADFSWENINTPPDGVEIEEGTTPPNNGSIQFTNLSSEAEDDWIIEQWYTYKWDFDDLSSSLEENPLHEYTNNGDFYVTLTTESAYGCKDSIEKTVDVDLMSGLFVPNAFNPGNPDAQVALFLPKGIGLYTYHVEILDNWGNAIWESDKIEDGSPAEGWDGTKNGVLLPQGVYIWRIRAVFTNGATWQGMEINGKNHREGSVTLIQ
jgi:PKD repeat protein